MFMRDEAIDELLSSMDSKHELASPGSAGARSEAKAERRSIERRTTAGWAITDQKSHRRCPVCSTEMFRMTVERVFLERCPAHGIWFDQNELQRVLAPNVDEDSFGEDQARRQGVGDLLELGTLGVVIQAVYRESRRPKS
jgi:Transcription factor zinc-finger